MFLIGIFGLGSKLVPLAPAPNIRCPHCGGVSLMSVSRSYDYFHAFFLPVAKWRSQYFLTCPLCASVFSLDAQLGKRYQRGEAPEIPREALELLQPGPHRCAACGAAQPHDGAYCHKCGARL